MKIAAICCTYKRPKQLETVIECFLRQEYPTELRELIVLDDANQYTNEHSSGWCVVSLPVRFRTLGEKRNASAALASADVEAYCVWDDDDIYLPWHMSAAAAALADADYAIPTTILHEAQGRLKAKRNRNLFHGAWSYRREVFDLVGGYPFIQSGQDQGLLRRFRTERLQCGDPIRDDQRPSYIYRWCATHTNHISAMGGEGYELRGVEQFQKIDALRPNWDRDWVELASEAMREPVGG